ncbi:MAG: ribosome maturation factor RimM [Anaerolineales bacterium]|jgi:16S rRNA processing protein RimM
MAAEESSKPTGAPGEPGEDLVLGRIVRPHGIRGMLLVEGFTEVIHSLRPTMEILLGFNRVPAVVRSFRAHRAQFLLSIEGCNDRDTAENWRGQDIFLRLDDAEPLPDGVYYHWQILGLNVVTQEGELLGTVEQILETGANDVYVVHTQAGEELLLPAIESVVLKTDLENKQLIVCMIPGLRNSDLG